MITQICYGKSADIFWLTLWVDNPFAMKLLIINQSFIYFGKKLQKCGTRRLKNCVKIKQSVGLYNHNINYKNLKKKKKQSTIKIEISYKSSYQWNIRIY